MKFKSLIIILITLMLLSIGFVSATYYPQFNTGILFYSNMSNGGCDDVRGNHAGTSNSITSVTGYYGDADGAGQSNNKIDYCYINDDTFLDGQLTNGHTISLLFKTDSFGTTLDDVLTTIGDGFGGYTGYQIDHRNPSTKMRYFDGASNEFTFDLALGNWYHMLVIASATNTSVYINGTQRYSDASDGRLSYAQDKLIMYNKRTIGLYYKYLGNIDEYALFNWTFSAQDIQDYWNDGDVVRFDGTDFHDSFATEDINPPLIYNPTCTSCPSGTNISTETDPNTPTVVVYASDRKSIDGVCISNSSVWNYTQCTQEGAKCTATGLNYTCTIPADNAFGFGNNTAYFWANDTLGNSHNAYNLSIDIRSPELSGTCEDSDGNGISGCMMMITQNGTFNIVDNKTSDANGYVEFAVEPGTYRLHSFYDNNDTFLRGDSQGWKTVE